MRLEFHDRAIEDRYQWLGCLDSITDKEKSHDSHTEVYQGAVYILLSSIIP